MKKIVIFIFITFYNISNSQTIEVKYYENRLIKNPETLKGLPKNILMDYEQNLFSYTLTNNGKESIYKNDPFNIKSEDQEDVFITISENGDTIKNIIKTKAFDSSIKKSLYYKNFNANLLITELSAMNENYIIQDSLSIIKWTQTNEIQEILGYKCKKATSSFFGSTFSAWFTEDIPIQDGPDMYCGLPGLILKITNNSLEMIAYSIKEQKEIVKIEKPSFEEKKYSFKDFELKIKAKIEEQKSNQLNSKKEFSKIDFSNPKKENKINIKTD